MINGVRVDLTCLRPAQPAADSELRGWQWRKSTLTPLFRFFDVDMPDVPTERLRDSERLSVCAGPHPDPLPQAREGAERSCLGVLLVGSVAGAIVSFASLASPAALASEPPPARSGNPLRLSLNSSGSNGDRDRYQSASRHPSSAPRSARVLPRCSRCFRLRWLHDRRSARCS